MIRGIEGAGRPCSPYKIDSDNLKAYVRNHPDAFLNEIAEHFGVTSPAVHAAMKRLKITRKKSRCYTKNEAKKSDRSI